MEVQDKKSIRAKSFAMRAIMKDKKLSKTLFDAWEAPAGSTKNAKAKAILKSLNQANSNYGYIQDGQGGIWDWAKGLFQGDQSTPTPTPIATPEVIAPTPQPLSQAPGISYPSNFAKSIDHLVPSQEMSVSEVEKEPIDSWLKNFDPTALQKGFTEKVGLLPEIGKAGLEAIQPVVGLDIPKQIIQKAWPWIKPAITAEPIRDILKTLPGLLYKPQPLDEIKASLFDWAPRAGFPKPEEEKKDIVPRLPTLTPEKPEGEGFRAQVYDDTGKAIDKWIFGDTREEVLANAEKSGVKPENLGYSFRIPKVEVPSALTATQPPITDVGVTEQVDPTENMIQQIADLDSNELGVWYNSLDPSLQDYSSNLLSAYTEGIGAEAFAMRALSNKEMLAEALGMSEEAAKLLPESPLLATQINDLRDTIKEEFKLQEQENKILELQNRGLSIESDLQSYIKGRDQYLGDIDKLLDEAYGRMAYMDTSNPYVAQRMKNYLNYLTILKGRQNQRYVNMLDTAIDYHDKEIKRATNFYESTFKKANDIFIQQAAITKESYDSLKSMLEDMYNNIENRSDAAMKMEEHEWRRAQEDRDAAMHILKLVELAKKIDSPDIGKVSTGDMKVVESMFGAEEGPSYDPQFVFSNYNPWQVKLEASQAGMNSEYAFNTFLGRMGNVLTKSSLTGTFTEELNKFKDSRDQSRSALNELLIQTELSAEEEQAIIQFAMEDIKLSEKMQNSIREGVKVFLLDEIDELRDAIKNLAKRYNKGKDNFIKKNSRLGDIASVLYDLAQTAIEDPSNQDPGKLTPENIFSGYETMDDNALASQMAIDLSNFLTF